MAHKDLEGPLIFAMNDVSHHHENDAGYYRLKSLQGEKPDRRESANKDP
jgi:hypothetical protein